MHYGKELFMLPTFCKKVLIMSSSNGTFKHREANYRVLIYKEACDVKCFSKNAIRGVVRAALVISAELCCLNYCMRVVL